ncbi:MAG TPA: aminotransferase class I/II-fold pyridoxal phosphate-dependent enzyme [Pirellulaceae bacterium]
MTNSPPPRLFLSPPHMSGREQEYLNEVFASNYIAPVGPHLQRFEAAFARYIGVEHAVAVASGTAAIHLVLRALGIGPGDEVLCSTFTFCASANPIVYQGATPVFIDAEESTWNLDLNLVEEELRTAASKGRVPKAIVAVDALGQCVDIETLRSIADPYEVPVLQDSAESLGSTYKGRPAGRDAWCSTYSFNGNKIITTGGGGMICSRDGNLVAQARYLSTQARDPVPHYEHAMIGYNYRMSNVLAAIGLAQLEALDDRVQARRRIRDTYKALLEDVPGISFMPDAPYGCSNCWLTTVRIDPNRYGHSSEELRQELERFNMESRKVWKPLHMQPAYAGVRCRGGEVAAGFFEDGLNLPSGSAMSESDVGRVCDVIKAFHATGRASA